MKRALLMAATLLVNVTNGCDEELELPAATVASAVPRVMAPPPTYDAFAAAVATD